MRKLKRILSLYLFVAVIMGAVVVAFDDAVSPTVYNEVQTETSVTENGAFPETEAATDEIKTEESFSYGENLPEKDGNSTYPSYEETSVAEKEADSEKPSGKPEIKEPESTASEAVTEKEEVVSEEEDIPEADFSEISYHNSYSPGGRNENVSDLLFLSDTVGKLADESSVNVYKFSVLSRSVFRYTVTHGAPQSVEGWKISLYGEYYPDGDGKNKAYRLIDELNTSVLSVDSSPEIGLASGEYRLVVTKGNAYDPGQYKISAFLEQSSSYEIECNDNIYRYTEIYSGLPIKGSASYFPDRQDNDYYLFRMYDDGFAELKFEHSAVTDKPTVCWQVMIYAEDGSCVYSVNSLFAESVNKSGRIGLVAGNYYVCVSNRVYTSMTYTLTMSRTEDSNYENEKNDTPETADAIAVGSVVSGTVASQISGLDRDYFVFETEKNGYCEIEFSHEAVADSDGKNGWNIVFTDKDGNIIYEGISAWDDDVVVSSAIGIGAGIYYIRIDSENLYNNSEKYYLTVNFTEASSWETESNNSFETADVLTAGNAVCGILAERESDYDYDYYVLDIRESTDITVSFSHEKLSGHKEIFNFTVYDSDKNALTCYSPTGDGTTKIKSYSDDETVTAAYKSLAPGRYYIRVSAGIFFDSIRYTLKY